MNVQKEKLVTIAFRAPEALKEKVIMHANKNYRSISAEARLLITNGMNNVYKEVTKESFITK